MWTLIETSPMSSFRLFGVFETKDIAQDALAKVAEELMNVISINPTQFEYKLLNGAVVRVRVQEIEQSLEGLY
jgi:hypothetical protein